MDDFVEEIKTMSRKATASEDNKTSEEENNEALNTLFNIASSGVNNFKENSTYPIRLHRLHADLVSLLFNFQNYCSGFVIRTKAKFSFVIQSKSNIFIYGLASRDGSQVKQSMHRTIQLLSLRYEKIKNEITFYDNTNKVINPQDVVLQVIKWGIS